MLPRALLKQHANLLSLLLHLLDGCIIFLAGGAAYYLRFGLMSIPPLYRSAIALGASLSVIIFSLSGMYTTSNQHFIQQLKQLLRVLAWIALLLFGCAFFLKQGENYSRIWLVTWMALSLLLLILCHYSIFYGLYFMRKQGLYERRVIIIGTSTTGKALARATAQELWTGWRIVAFLKEDGNLDPTNESFLSSTYSIPIQSKPDQLSQYLQSQNIDEVWIALPWQSMTQIYKIIHTLHTHPISIRLLVNLPELITDDCSIMNIAGYPVINIHSTPIIGINWLLKNIEDKVLSICILFCMSPLFLLIAFAIKWSSTGPILFKQKRVSWNGLEFEMLKFRTMCVDAEKKTGPVWTAPEDQRVTYIGKWLRRTSLDELPQLFNVLKGEMSIVGPRPERRVFIDQFKQYIPLYMKKHLVKAGITGWAQINGWRGNTNLHKRIEYDLHYIQHWSLGLDFKIIYLTLFRGFIHRNAY